MASVHQLPSELSLFIVTPERIRLRSRSNDQTLFVSEPSDGIVNARASKDNSSLIAVADSHLVMFYDTVRGRNKRYNLRKGDVREMSID